MFLTNLLVSMLVAIANCYLNPRGRGNSSVVYHRDMDLDLNLDSTVSDLGSDLRHEDLNFDLDLEPRRLDYNTGKWMAFDMQQNFQSLPIKIC